MRYRYCNYDITGDDDRGYDVIATYETDTTVNLTDKALSSTKALVTALKRQKLFRPDVQPDRLHVQRDRDGCVYVYLASTFKPVCEFRPEVN